MPLKRATVLVLSEEFQKNLTLYCSSASGLQSQQLLSRLTSIPVVPQPKKNEKILFLPVLATFSAKWLGHREYQCETRRNQLILQYRRRTEILHKMFPKFCLQADISGRFFGIFGTKLVKIVILRGHICLQSYNAPAAPMTLP